MLDWFAHDKILYRIQGLADRNLLFSKSSGEKSAKPLLLEGQRACPPEDCGGPELFMDTLAGELEFLDDRYDPAKFDPKKTKFR